jgi:hypothetical protein
MGREFNFMGSHDSCFSFRGWLVGSSTRCLLHDKLEFHFVRLIVLFSIRTPLSNGPELLTAAS